MFLRHPTSLALAFALVSCVSIDANVVAPADPALGAFQHARVRTCPAASLAPRAHTGGESESRGVAVEDIALVPLAGEPARALRLRRLTVAPGGTVAWHDHRAVQGMALMVAGEMRETRNSCRERMLYRAGDIAVEDADTAHSWRNEGDTPAIVLTAHAVAR